MALDKKIRDSLTLPVICAPMFLVSGPDLVREACKAGVIGGLPVQNSRSYEQFSDKVRLLATAADERGEFLPDVPTFKELGIEGVVEQGWTALFVRSDTPKPIIETLRRVFAEVTASVAMKEHFKKLGASPYKMSIERFQGVLESELETKRDEARRLGIEPQ